MQEIAGVSRFVSFSYHCLSIVSKHRKFNRFEEMWACESICTRGYRRHTRMYIISIHRIACICCPHLFQRHISALTFWYFFVQYQLLRRSQLVNGQSIQCNPVCVKTAEKKTPPWNKVSLGFKGYRLRQEMCGANVTLLKATRFLPRVSYLKLVDAPWKWYRNLMSK